jgi:hypothetical protein
MDIKKGVYRNMQMRITSEIMLVKFIDDFIKGKFHNLGDAEPIVMGQPLRGDGAVRMAL